VVVVVMMVVVVDMLVLMMVARCRTIVRLRLLELAVGHDMLAAFCSEQRSPYCVAKRNRCNMKAE
jgi:hypothetical protein